MVHILTFYKSYYSAQYQLFIRMTFIVSVYTRERYVKQKKNPVKTQNILNRAMYLAVYYRLVNLKVYFEKL